MNYNFNLINADTDSILICKPDGSAFSKEQLIGLLSELNDLFPEHINWDDDGYFSKVLVLKAKNYILVDPEGKLTIKGSALKDQKKPLVLQTFLKDVVDLLLMEKPEEIIKCYNNYCQNTKNIKDIKPWSKKITLTKKVLEPTRTNEQKQFDALKGRKVQEGDKVWVFFKSDKSLSLIQDWDGDYDRNQLLKNIHMALKTFQNLIDFPSFPNYTLKRNKQLLEDLDNET